MQDGAQDEGGDRNRIGRMSRANRRDQPTECADDSGEVLPQRPARAGPATKRCPPLPQDRRLIWRHTSSSPVRIPLPPPRTRAHPQTGTCTLPNTADQAHRLPSRHRCFRCAQSHWHREIQTRPIQRCRIRLLQRDRRLACAAPLPCARCSTTAPLRAISWATSLDRWRVSRLSSSLWALGTTLPGRRSWRSSCVGWRRWISQLRGQKPAPFNPILEVWFKKVCTSRCVSGVDWWTRRQIPFVQGLPPAHSTITLQSLSASIQLQLNPIIQLQYLIVVLIAGQMTTECARRSCIEKTNCKLAPPVQMLADSHLPYIV